MSLSLNHPVGFHFFVICNAIAVFVLSTVKSIVDILPDDNIIRFSFINGLGLFLFVCSVYAGSKMRAPNDTWLLNGFTLSALSLIVYSMIFEIHGAMHVYWMPVLHIFEVLLVIFVARRLANVSDRKRYAQMVAFTTGARKAHI